MVAVGGDAGKGSGTVVYSANHPAQSVEKIFHLHF